MKFIVDLFGNTEYICNTGGVQMQWNLIKARKERKLSQEHLATLLGINKTTYGLKERGQLQFTSDEMFTLQAFFGKRMDEIFLPRNLGNTEVLRKEC